MENKDLGLPEWPKRAGDVDSEGMELLVAADAMRVDAAKWRMLNETEFDARTADQHVIHALSITVTLSSHLAVAALKVLRTFDPGLADAVCRDHWNAAEYGEPVADLWQRLQEAGVDVTALREPAQKQGGTA